MKNNILCFLTGLNFGKKLLQFLGVTMISLFVTSCNSSITQSPVTLPLKSITIWQHSYTNGKVEENGIRSSYEGYNENGMMIENISFNSSGSLNSRITNKYNEKGQVIEQACYGSNGRLVDMSINSYNTAGKISEADIYRNNNLFIKRVYKYSEQENLLEIYNNCPGFDTWRESYKYNDKGYAIEVNINYQQNYSNDQKTTYKVDDAGNILEEIQYYSNNIISKYKATYDQNNRRLEYIIYDVNTGEISSKTNYSYLNNGKLNEEIAYKGDGALSSKYIYKYDQIGNPTEKIYETPAGQVSIFKWVYNYFVI
jgi:hypothetical protein